VHPCTVGSGAHAVDAFVRQQYEVLPLAPAVPTLHTKDGVLATGESAPVHE
jgi:hypothetical protein